MKRAAATIALMSVTLLCAGCASVSGVGIFGLGTPGGTRSDNSPALPVAETRKSPHPEFFYPHNLAWEFRPNERLAAATQKHRTPRAKPPAHNFLTKPVATGRLTSGHGYRVSPLGTKPRKHNGVDYAAAKGTEVYAAGAGIVERIYRSKSYGNYIRIRHADGYATAYAHLHSYAKDITRGAIVKRGQTIGTVGSTGRSTGNHLHFELIYKGRFVDPLSNTVKTELADTGTNVNSLTQN